MTKRVLIIGFLVCKLNLLNAQIYDITDFGAKGDSATINSDFINNAIDEAARNGGGTIYFPAGKYLSYTIRLKSNISIHLDQGAVLIAAVPALTRGYDLPEPETAWDMYQDFGHNHWRNSLIWGEGLQNIAIYGHGTIDGIGLNGGADKNDPAGTGNKAIGLKLCKNVTIRDITFYRGGHFCLLATGVDNLTLDNIKVDSNRDGFDIDCCKNVRISNCTVNTPADDAICLKSSYALGYARVTENITITNCQVSAYDLGTFLNGTYQKTYRRRSVSGRIKFGTESNGGFRNITISNCVFDYSRGLALETVDGGILEDIAITNITMRDVMDVPLFIRLGLRMSAPEGTPKSICRRIIVNNLIAYNVDPTRGIMIMGSNGHDVEDVELSNLKIYYRKGGGVPPDSTNKRGYVFGYVGKKGDIDIDVPELDMAFPEKVKSYPEPHQWGALPSYALYARHVKNLRVHHAQFFYDDKNEMRPPFVLDDVKDVTFQSTDAMKDLQAPFFFLKNVSGFRVISCKGISDVPLQDFSMKKIYK